MHRFHLGRLRCLGFLGLVPLFRPDLGWMRVFLLVWLLPLLADLVRWVRRSFRSGAPDGCPTIELPGPAARGGGLLFVARCHLSELMSLISSTGRSQVLAQLRGEAAARERLGGVEPRVGEYQQKARYTLPFAGEWLVVNGGETSDTSHSWGMLSQRYAYDFLVADEQGRTHRDDGRRVEDYYAYGRPILAPCDGGVVAAVDGLRAAPGVGTGTCARGLRVRPGGGGR